MKKILLAVALVGATAVYAAPFAQWFDVTSPTGKAIRVYGEGDEIDAWFEAEDGHAVWWPEGAAGYMYMRKLSDGSLVSTGILVGEEAGHETDLALIPLHERDTSEIHDLEVDIRILEDELLNGKQDAWEGVKAESAVREQADELAEKGIYLAPSSTTLGTIVGCTILVDFPLDSGSGSYWNTSHPDVTAERVSNYLNGGPGVKEFNNECSVRQYYWENSCGNLNYTNVVIGPIKLSHPRSYYDTDEDTNVTGFRFVEDVVATMKSQGNFTSDIKPKLEQLSVDSTGRVRALNILFAGGEAPHWSKGLWAHSGTDPLATGVKGKTFGRYQISPCCGSPSLYVFCHENGHMICGFPDFYRYKGRGHNLVGTRCLMADRTAAKNPGGISGYLRYKAGWFSPKTLPQNSPVSITRDYSDVYKYPNPNNAKEYYIIENRGGGRDNNITGTGIIIWHCNESGGNTNVEGLNPNFTSADGNAQYRLERVELTMEQADGQYHMERGMGYDGKDFWFGGNPAPDYGDEFSDASMPTAKWIDGSLSQLQLSQFSAIGETMTFICGDPSLIGGPVGSAVQNGGSGFFATIDVTLTDLGLDAHSVEVTAEYVSDVRGRNVFSSFPMGTLTSTGTHSIPIPFPGNGLPNMVRIRFTNDQGRSSTTPIIEIDPVESLASALDAIGMDFVNSSGQKWEPTRTESYYNGSCLKYTSTDSTYGYCSLLNFTVTAPCTITFYAKVVRSNNGDNFDFKVTDKAFGGSDIRSITTSDNVTTGWQYITATISGSGAKNLYITAQHGKTGSSPITFYIDKFTCSTAALQEGGGISVSVNASSISQTNATISLTEAVAPGKSITGRHLKVSANTDYSSPACDKSIGASPEAITGLNPNTRYYVLATVNGSDSQSYYGIGSFDTPDWTPPEGTVTAQNITFDSAMVVATITNYGSESAETVETSVQVASDADFNELVYEGGVPHTLDGLVANTTYYMRATFNGVLASPGIATGTFTTFDYTAPTIGSVVGGAKSVDWADVTVSITDLGSGSSGVTIRIETTGGIFVETNANAIGSYTLQLNGLSRNTVYPLTVTATSSTGKVAVDSSASVKTDDGPEYQLRNQSVSVNTNGLSAVMSVDVPALNVNGHLYLYLNDGKDPIATWDSGTGNFCFTNNVARGSTNTYEFVAIGDLEGKFVTNRVSGIFIATTYTDWFNVKFNDSGYITGASWMTSSHDKSEGTWTSTANPTFTVLSADPSHVLKFDDEHDEIAKYTASKPSEVNADVSVTGEIKAQTGNGLDIPDGVFFAIKFIAVDDEHILPAVYNNGDWHSFGTGGVAEGTLLEYQVDFDYSSADAPRCQVTMGSFVSPWYSLSLPERKLSAVGFAGADVGDFKGWYWSLLQDVVQKLKGTMFFLK